MIKIDLHIHSCASRYKESSNIVDESTPENAHILLSKLEEYKVSLFSITDHNRFNVELYETLDRLIANGDYPSVQGLVAGVEFDVKLDPAMDKCHIVTIFDAGNKPENYQRIYDVISANIIEEPEGYYEKEDFEKILCGINLDTILIACQRSSFDNHGSKHNSLSDSTQDPLSLLQVGYINALEFQKPNVEGIIQDSLRTMPEQVLLVSGSDCHEWKSYPYHDKKNKNKSFVHSKARILPSFKGLLMAVTSPETRINRQENNNPTYIKDIQINDQRIPLVNGINAIIGENGSGKSTVLKCLYGELTETHVRRIARDNAIIPDNVEKSKIRHIGQGEIVTKFENNSLFDNTDNFIDIDHEPFRTSYERYAESLLSVIRKQIKKKESKELLAQKNLEYSELAEKGLYYVLVEYDESFAEVSNPHEKPHRDLVKIKKSIQALCEDAYFERYLDQLEVAKNAIDSILTEVTNLFNTVAMDKKTKNAIVSAIETYTRKITPESTSHDNECRAYQQKRKAFINAITNAITLSGEEINLPSPPETMEGYSQNIKQGFRFTREAAYNNKDMHNDFLQTMFKKEYANKAKIQSIDSLDTFVEAVKNCTNVDDLERVWKSNLELFLRESCKTKEYIIDDVEEQRLGNTLGEMSLAYYKYFTQNSAEWNVFIIDQPEDHISNNNISQRLMDYLNSIRYTKQLIFVTHNPLLVVNMDVDNVIYLKKENDTIRAVYGCLESEADGNNILDIVANNMDGGKASIEKRLRVYGKEN